MNQEAAKLSLSWLFLLNKINYFLSGPCGLDMEVLISVSA